MSTDGEGTLSALAGPTHGSEQERKRMMPEVKAERKANIHLACVENVLFSRFPDKAVHSKPFMRGLIHFAMFVAIKSNDKYLPSIDYNEMTF